MEAPLAEELEELGFKSIEPGKRSVQFESDLSGIYKANLASRHAMSILVAKRSFKFRNKTDLYEQAFEIDWEQIFDVRGTFIVKCTMFGDAFANSTYPALVVKDAIADRFRKFKRRRPNVNRERPDIVVDVYIRDNHCVISLNSSGPPLYLRGYRNMPFDAPLNECLAAGMVALTGWKADQDLINPMCGSGTLIVEAAMMACKVHPAKLRDEFSFKNWLDFDQAEFDKVRKELLDGELKKSPVRLIGSDKSNRSVSIARNSLFALGLEDQVELSKMDFFKPKVSTDSGVLILNPPYDERLELEAVEEFYNEIGRVLKFDYNSHQAWVLSSNLEAMKKIGLKASNKFDLLNGKLECKYMSFDLYEGSKKDV